MRENGRDSHGYDPIRSCKEVSNTRRWGGPLSRFFWLQASSERRGERKCISSLLEKEKKKEEKAIFWFREEDFVSC